MDVRLTWNEKDANHLFINMILTYATIIGWVDVPDTDRSDFGRRPAVGISNC